MSYYTAFKRQQPRNDDEESLSVPYILITNTPLESFIVDRIQEALSIYRGRSVKPGKQAERTRTLRKSLILTLPPRWKWWALSRTTSNCEPRCTFPPPLPLQIRLHAAVPQHSEVDPGRRSRFWRTQNQEHPELSKFAAEY